MKFPQAFIALLFLFGCSFSLLDSARIYEKRGDYNTAIRYYERIAELRSREIDKLPLYMKIAQLYSRLGNFDAAQVWFEKCLIISRNYSDNTLQTVLAKSELQYIKALNALEDGNYKLCIELLENLIKTKESESLLGVGNNFDIHYYLSIAYARQAESYSFQNTVTGTSVLLSPELSQTERLLEEGCNLLRSDPTSFNEARIKFELALRALPKQFSPRNNFESALYFLREKEYVTATKYLFQLPQTPDIVYYSIIACYKCSILYGQKAANWLMDERDREAKEEAKKLYDKALENLGGI